MFSSCLFLDSAFTWFSKTLTVFQSSVEVGSGSSACFSMLLCRDVSLEPPTVPFCWHHSVMFFLIKFFSVLCVDTDGLILPSIFYIIYGNLAMWLLKFWKDFQQQSKRVNCEVICLFTFSTLLSKKTKQSWMKPGKSKNLNNKNTTCDSCLDMEGYEKYKQR